MAKIVRFNGNLQAFASAAVGTERTLFGEVTQADDLTSQFTTDFFRGWGIVGPSDQPALEDFNAVGYTLSQILAYLHQMGVPEYNAAQEYHLGSITSSGSILYTSLANSNTGNTPATTPASWRPVGSGQLLRTTIYRNNAGTLQASVDGGAYANSSSTFAKHPDAIFGEGEVLGGGASGANAALTGGAQVSAGPGGGGGGWSFKRAPIASFNGATISVGAGGVASANQAGASSAIGALITATGGAAVVTGPAATATNIPFGISDGGVGSGGDINSNGGVGWWSLYGSTPQSGTGGSSKYGFGPTGVGGTATTGTVGNNAVSPGCGGSGAACGNSVAAPKAGGAGAGGLVIIREFR